jgi:hypothetical protein
MFDVMFVKASEWFEDEAESGYVAVTKNWVFEVWRFEKPGFFFNVDKDIDRGDSYLVGLGKVRIGVTKKC